VRSVAARLEALEREVRAMRPKVIRVVRRPRIVPAWRRPLVTSPPGPPAVPQARPQAPAGYEKARLDQAEKGGPP
jgi:hypothetical protein